MSCKNYCSFQESATLKVRHEANARERTRTYSVNSAFAMLRNLIPTEPPDRKLSKIETLKLACSYISHLGSILVEGTCETSPTGPPPSSKTAVLNESSLDNVGSSSFSMTGLGYQQK